MVHLTYCRENHPLHIVIFWSNIPRTKPRSLAKTLIIAVASLILTLQITGTLTQKSERHIITYNVLS